ncbi:MAG: hypothetical protein Q9227_003487 [Pyrenula ochraceoflavens]
MTFPPPQPAQSSIASSSDSRPPSRSSRAQQAVWGPPLQQSRPQRGLAPLATSNLTSNTLTNFGSNPRRAGAASSPDPQATVTSPLASSFSSVLSSAARLNGNRNSSNSSASPFTPIQTGSQQQASLQSGPNRSSPRPPSVTPSSAYHLASSTASATSQGGGGGSGGGGGGAATARGGFSPSLSSTNVSSPTNFSFDRSAIQGPASAIGSGGQSSLSKISTAQVLLLLDSISEKEGKAKWDSKAEQIRKVSSQLLLR